MITEEFEKSKNEKINRLLALKKCGIFISLATNEAAWDQYSFSFFSRMRDSADLIPIEFETIDQSSSVKVQDGRLQPYIRSQLFIALISELEDFIKSIMQIILFKYPRKLGNEKVSINELLDQGHDSAIRLIIDWKINDIFYLSPKKYGEKICDILSMDYGNISTIWPFFFEMKGRRDVGIQNSWKKNEIYIYKVNDVGGNIDDNEFLGISDIYFEDSIKNGLELIEVFASHCKDKFK